MRTGMLTGFDKCYQLLTELSCQKGLLCYEKRNAKLKHVRKKCCLLGLLIETLPVVKETEESLLFVDKHREDESKNYIPLMEGIPKENMIYHKS